MNLSLCYYTQKDNDFDETVEIFEKYFTIYSSVNMRQVKESLKNSDEYVLDISISCI